MLLHSLQHFDEASVGSLLDWGDADPRHRVRLGQPFVHMSGKVFPTPTRSQILRAYPKSVLKNFGHANIFMLLDATEIFAEIVLMKTVNAILYSAYKHMSTMKWLAGCDPIGYMWADSIGIGHGGSISDPVATAVSRILECIPFGMAVKVDKGFLIKNDCALLGIICV